MTTQAPIQIPDVFRKAFDSDDKACPDCAECGEVEGWLPCPSELDHHAYTCNDCGHCKASHKPM